MERILYLNDRFCAVAEDGRLVEYIPVRPEDQDRADPDWAGGPDHARAGAAFVDIGRKEGRVSSLKENSQTFQGGPLRSGDRCWFRSGGRKPGQRAPFCPGI